MSTFPTSVPAGGSATPGATLAAIGHTALHNNMADEIVALATKMGTGASTPSSGRVLRSSSTGTSVWGQVDQTTDITGILPVANGGTGQSTLTALPLPSPAITGTVTGGATYSSPTLTTPTIASFANATHTHTNSAGGGQLTGSALVDDTVTDAKMDYAATNRRHYNCLFFSNDNGTVFGSSQVRTQYDTSDTTANYGITATTGASAKLTTARDGVYQIELRFKCVDVNASSFITWIYVSNVARGTQFIRRADQAIAVGQSQQWSATMWLPAGTDIYQEWYNGGGNTRFGSENINQVSDTQYRRLTTSLTVTEVGREAN